MTDDDDDGQTVINIKNTRKKVFICHVVIILPELPNAKVNLYITNEGNEITFK